MARRVLGCGAVSGHVHAPAAGSEPRPKLKLAQVLQAAKGHLAEPSYSAHTRSVLQTLRRCQSAELGYHVLDCDACAYQVKVPRGCGSRHCPSCGHQRAEDWVVARKLELLDCRYHEVVITLPPVFYPLVKENPERLYGLLLSTVREVLDELARDPKHLGGVPQFLLALHTWNGALDFHVHVHGLIAAGAYAPDTDRWIPSKHPDFLFPIEVLSALFRGKFLAGLKKLEAAGLLQKTWPINEDIANPVGWSLFLDQAYRTRFFTYVGKTAAGPGNVIEYLGHYLYQTGFSNARLVALDGDEVTYLCKDRKKRHSTTGTYPRTLRLDAFVRLFAQHILPKGFHRIRFCGLWSHTDKGRLLPRARAALLCQGHARPPSPPYRRPGPPPRPPAPCPSCGTGTLVLGCTVVLTPHGAVLLPHLRARPPPGAPPGPSHDPCCHPPVADGLREHWSRRGLGPRSAGPTGTGRRGNRRTRPARVSIGGHASPGSTGESRNDPRFRHDPSLSPPARLRQTHRRDASPGEDAGLGPAEDGRTHASPPKTAASHVGSRL